MTSAVQVLAIVALAPFLQGCMKTLRARLSGRPGPSPLQAYRDLAKLWRKEALLPDGVSVLALLAPGVALGVAATFAAALPLAHSFSSSLIDVVALAMLLALGRFVTTLVALDTRSGFAGMAASREMTFASLVEPALLIALLGGAATRARNCTAIARRSPVRNRGTVCNRRIFPRTSLGDGARSDR